jgi:hypothetical protein
MEITTHRHAVLVLQAGSDQEIGEARFETGSRPCLTGATITIRETEGDYDGAAAHEEGEQLFRTLANVLPSYTTRRLLSLLMRRELQLAQEIGNAKLAATYTAALEGIEDTGRKSTAGLEAFRAIG